MKRRLSSVKPLASSQATNTRAGTEESNAEGNDGSEKDQRVSFSFLRPDGSQCYPRDLLLAPTASQCWNQDLSSLAARYSHGAGSNLWAILLKKANPCSVSSFGYILTLNALSSAAFLLLRAESRSDPG